VIAAPLVRLAAATSESGGKAAALARLAAAGLRVPPGWIVPAEVPDTELAEAAGHLAAWAAASAPHGLIARSSAPGEDGQGASFAGLFTSCFTATGRIGEAIARVRASRTASAIAAYAHRAGLEPPAGMPVLVQPALRPYAAGVAAAETSCGHATRWRIEAVHGLAEPLVSGTCTGEAHHGEAGDITTRPAAQRRLFLPGTPAELLIPPGDTITVSHLRLGPSVLKVAHSAGSIVEFYRPPAWAAAPVLQDEDRDRIVALASAAASALETERIDIEWALLPDGTLWLVQARPLTAPLPPPDAADRPGGTQWAGLPGSPGRASGPAAPLGEAPVAPSAVLVCPALDASSVTALLGRPAAIVAAAGGTLSHTAILARELGIPAVVRVTGAMTLFSPGQYLDVDGTAGTVRLAAAPQPTSRPPGQGQRDDGRTASCVLPGAAPEGQDGEFRAVIIDGDGPASAAAVLASVGAVSPGCGILVIDPRSAVPALPPAYQVTEPARLTRLITGSGSPVPVALAARDSDGGPLHKRPGQATGWHAADDYLPAPVAGYAGRIVGPFELAATRSWRYHGGEVWEIAADGDRYIVKRHSDGRRWRQEVAGYERAAALPPGRVPRLTGADEDLAVIITTVLPGAGLDRVALSPAGERDAYWQAGTLLRALHEAARSGPDARVADRLIAKSQAALATTRPSLTSAETVVIASQIAQMQQLAAQLPAVATHGDFRPRNLLWDPGARILGVIDFEKAAPAPAARDIASITAAMPHGRDDLLAAFYQGLGREPHGSELAAVSAFTVLTALTDYAWGQENGDHAAVSAARATFARHATLTGKETAQ
jgi:pyruvate,water dikinase